MGRQAYIVDDEENIREIVKCALESCGIEVVGFEDAVSMLTVLKTDIPDIILLDIMLPGMDGLEALRRIKSNPESTSIPVLMLSAKGAETDRVAGLDLGADDYIVKPFGVLELMARVRAALRRTNSKSEKKTVYEYNELKLDTESHEVTHRNKPVELTLKEFDLLQIMMENAGKAMARNVLLDKVWGYSYIGETRTLDMHVRSLRQKLHDADGRYISTVRGIGYKFNASANV
ncbi:MAG TPA: response regulator transcription factor [Ruminiclostridium sp.]|nr:response regulator transcription factor [Ruminiclostridium sp.]